MRPPPIQSGAGVLVDLSLKSDRNDGLETEPARERDIFEGDALEWGIFGEPIVCFVERTVGIRSLRGCAPLAWPDDALSESTGVLGAVRAECVVLTVRCEWERETSGESDGPAVAGDASDLVEGPAAAREGRRECVRELAEDAGPDADDVGIERRETDLSAMPAPVSRSSRVEGCWPGGGCGDVDGGPRWLRARSLQAPDLALPRPPERYSASLPRWASATTSEGRIIPS